MPLWLKRLFSGRSDRAEEPDVRQQPDTAGRLAQSMRKAFQLHEAGDLEGAERAYRAILEEHPGDAEALYLLGEIANATGRRTEAIGLIRRAIASNDGVAAFHHELGLAYFHSGRHAEAALAFAAAVALEPMDVAAHVNLGAALQADGRPEEAAEAWRRAVALDGSCLSAYCNLAGVYLTLGREDDAWTAVRHAVALAPEGFEPRMREGDVLLELGRPDDAIVSYTRAQRLDPGSPRAEVALGYALDIAGRVEEALTHYDKAIALDPSNVSAHVSRASAHLLQEKFVSGWDEYEWRTEAPENARLHARFRPPAWRGEPLAGRTILYYAEQGIGDEIMYASCLPDLLSQASRCIVDCDPRLESLFRRSFPRAIVRGGTQSGTGDWLDAMGPVDFKISAASLPRLLRRSASDFPPHSGYLASDLARKHAHTRRLETLGQRRKIGICWRGGVLRTGRNWRSLAPEALLPVLRTPGVTFVSLQRDASAEELDRLRNEHGIAIEHWQATLDDVDECAALLASMDLTVSVCTWIVHLAGGQGLPVWVMAPIRPEPRYGLAGSAMRWYPSARVFRQPAFGAWDEVVTAVSRELEVLASSTG